MNTLLELKQIKLHYKNYNTSVEVIKGIDLKIHSGEKVAVVGKSGSGKTSLIMLMGGLEKPSSGEIIFDQQSISSFSEDQLADIRKQKIGIVFQSFYLIPNYTALENVSLILEINGDKNAKQQAEELLVQFGLKDRLNHFPTQLSGGEQQRVAIARSMAVKPKMILADEPTGNLDSENSDMISKLLFEYADKNQSSLVLVTHDLKFAEKCDRMIKIEDGMIV
ncbi:ABC transporter ATP-binding protein [Pelagibacteraceae bacterium]|jgi:putative ABC transport system ATP-binding protein|nr:ABC transporter ATP-binding protein [Pelagibacteraceae bacterium]MDC1148184.1 ABC transporter ATP-binding protein [Pelagibacteraceae bacterium]